VRSLPAWTNVSPKGCLNKAVGLAKSPLRGNPRIRKKTLVSLLERAMGLAKSPLRGNPRIRKKTLVSLLERAMGLEPTNISLEG
jgi:hypothetical protein